MNEFSEFWLDGGSIDYFQLEEFYSVELIKELKNQGIRVKEDKLIAIDRNYGEDRIVWLELGTWERGLTHIHDHHYEDFEVSFRTSDLKDIADLIFTTITFNEADDVFPSSDPLSSNLVYVYGVGGYYLYIIIDGDGEIITAYPRRI